MPATNMQVSFWMIEDFFLVAFNLDRSRDDALEDDEDDDEDDEDLDRLDLFFLLLLLRLPDLKIKKL